MIDNDRLNHSLAVARKIVEIGKLYNLKDDELRDLYVLGFNHDIMILVMSMETILIMHILVEKY